MSQAHIPMADVEIAVVRSGEHYAVELTVDGQPFYRVECGTLDVAMTAKALIEDIAIKAGGTYITEVASQGGH